jgi:oligopeptidase B
MNLRSNLVKVCLAAFALSGCVASAPPKPRQPAPEPTQPAVMPPVAKREAKVETLHGEKRVDDYFWLRNKGTAEVEGYLKAENAYTEALMKPTESLQDLLYREMLARIQETDVTVPYPKGNWLYYSRTEQGKQYPIHCRRKGTDAPEQVILDLNELATGEKYLSLGSLEVSDDGNLAAYSTDTSGFRQYTLRIKDLRTGQLGSEAIPKVNSFAWAADNRTLFYVVEDSAKRPYHLYRHRLGSPMEQDAPLYEEQDEMFNLQISRSRSHAYLFALSQSHTASEVRYLRASHPERAFEVISPREQNLEYYVDHHEPDFLIRTNSGGRNFRLVKAPVSRPDRSHWKEVLPHRDDVMLERIDAFARHYVAFEREDGLQRIRVVDFTSGRSQYVKLPESVYFVSPAQNYVFDTDKLRFAYQSFVTPMSVYDYHVRSSQQTLLKRIQVLGGYDPSLYRSERLHARAADGTLIPISVVYREGFKQDGKSPMLLIGYGSYGASFPITFSSDRISLLDRGVTFAVAHIRGGGEMGKKWHDQGRMMMKRNTFTDFISAAEYLVSSSYTQPDRLIVLGGSAGGLLMGAIANLRPDLFKAVVALVPFVDVINTMLDRSLPLTVGEFEEWGNPQNQEQYQYIRTYSPYDNLERKKYPTMLVRTSYNDSQVMYWEPAKYVAKLRTLKTDPNPLIFKINMEPAGHGGASGRYTKLRETAFDYAFVLWELGIRS